MLVKIFASFGLLICLALALHMGLGRQRQQWLQDRLSALWQRLKAPRLRQRFNRRDRRRAAHEAALEAIERARRRSGSSSSTPGHSNRWDGNVYRPKQFEKPRKPH